MNVNDEALDLHKYDDRLNNDVTTLLEDDVVNDDFFKNENIETNIGSADYALDDMIVKAINDGGEGGIKYIEEQTNLDIPNFKSLVIDDNRPYETMGKVSNILSDSFIYDKFIKEVEKVGEDVARYKWAYDEGKFGEFDGGRFSKEVIKAGLRSIGTSSLKMAGNILNVLGENLENNVGFGAIATSGAGLVLPKAKEVFKELGNTLNEYADKVNNMEILAPSYEAYQEEPNWMSVANVIGQGSGSVLAMGGIAKIVGSKATYGLFALGSGGEVFKESLDNDGDVNKANVLGAMNISSSYLIDKIFNPLPKQLEKGVKATSSAIAKEIISSPGREFGSEILQQVFSENLIRKIGIDDTQALFEGVIESAIGAMAGNAVVAGSDGGIYFANKSLIDIERKIKLKGVKEEEIELYKKNMLEFMKTKPEAFEKVLGYNLDRNVKEIIKSTEGIKNKIEVKKELKSLPIIYEKMYERLKGVVDDDVAKASARLFEANALFGYQYGITPSYLKLVEGFLPNVKRENFRDFLEREGERGAEFQFVGINAKGIDPDKLKTLRRMEKNNIDPQVIWHRTGGIRGSDGKLRFEISDKEAKFKLFDTKDFEKKYSRYRKKIVYELNLLQRQMANTLMGNKGTKYATISSDYLDYLRKNEDKLEKLEIKDETNNFLLKRYEDFQIIDKGIEIRRNFENDLIDFIYDEYKLQNKAIKGKSVDFADFVVKYWNDKKIGVINNVADDLGYDIFRWNIGDDFLERLIALAKDFERREKNISEKLNNSGEWAKDEQMDKLNMDEVFKIYLDENENAIKELKENTFIPDYYEKISARKDMETKFLEDEKYDFINEKDKSDLREYLKKVKRYYELERYIKFVNEIEKNIAIRENLEVKDKKNTNDELNELEETRLLIDNGMSFDLYELLEHKELFLNYPDIRDSKVLFTRLSDGQPYHFYWNKDEGYVFEIDAEQCDYSLMRDLLLKGTNFAVQHKEGFDYTLSPKQRKNYMDRHLYMAKKMLEKENKTRLKDFLISHDLYKNYWDIYKYWDKHDMPVSMVNIYKSERVDENNMSSFDLINYRDINFDRLTNDILTKFSLENNEESLKLKKQALADLFLFKEMISKKIMYTARLESGYKDVGLPWSGLVSQGATRTIHSSLRLRSLRTFWTLKPSARTV